jgi:hypothetical protein
MLFELRISDNRISGGFPSSIERWQDLEIFYIDKNALSGSLPTKIGLLSQLPASGNPP